MKWFTRPTYPIPTSVPTTPSLALPEREPEDPPEDLWTPYKDAGLHVRGDHINQSKHGDRERFT